MASLLVDPARPEAPAPEVVSRARPVSLAGEHILPVLAPLVALFPDGGLRRGSTVAVRPSPAGGATSLALALGVATSQTGSWCAAVGLPSLGLLAADGLGMALEHFALVPHPGPQWGAVMAALIDAVEVIVFRPPRGARPADARRLVAKARERGVVLVPCGDGWPEVADVRLSVVGGSADWHGLGYGHGFLQARAVEVVAVGRGAASRERRARLWLPGPDGRVAGDVRRELPASGPVTVGVAAAG